MEEVSMPEPPFDVRQAHRWFAIQLNNLAWDLVEAETRSGADVERMIHAAHASTYHWMEIGTPLNHQRAECLLATAYAAAGRGEAAVHHAERCLSLSQQAGDEQTPFDRATALGCAARAYAVMGRVSDALDFYERSREAAKALSAADGKETFEKLYPAP